MRLAYVDESYTKDYYFLGAIVVDACASSLGHALDDVVETASRAHGSVDPDAELHGHSIFHGKGVWASMPPRSRISVYDQALQAIREGQRAVVEPGQRSHPAWGNLAALNARRPRMRAGPKAGREARRRPRSQSTHDSANSSTTGCGAACIASTVS
jgi:hypothetical protein